MVFFSFIQLLESKFKNEVNNLEQKLAQLQSDIRDKNNQLQALKSQLNDKDNIIEVCEVLTQEKITDIIKYKALLTGNSDSIISVFQLCH